VWRRADDVDGQPVQSQLSWSLRQSASLSLGYQGSADTEGHSHVQRPRHSESTIRPSQRLHGRPRQGTAVSRIIAHIVFELYESEIRCVNLRFTYTTGEQNNGTIVWYKHVCIWGATWGFMGDDPLKFGIGGQVTTYTALQKSFHSLRLDHFYCM